MSIETIKFKEYSRSPKNRGAIFQMEADSQGLALIEAKVDSMKIYVTIDPESNKVKDAKFFTYGGPLYTAIAEIICNMIKESGPINTKHITAEYIELELRDDPNIPALEEDEGNSVFNLVEPLLAIYKAEYPEKKAQALRTRQIKEGLGKNIIPNDEWHKLSKGQKMEKIEACLDENVRTALNSDGGDMNILDIVDHTKVIIEYQGACQGCGAAGGGTLFYIENELRQKVYPGIEVMVDGLFDSTEGNL